MRLIYVMVTCIIIVFLEAQNGFSANSEEGTISQYNYNVDRNQIVEHFYKLSKAGGIINSPKLPEEFYHNARIYELSGDYINARKCYEDYLKFNLDFTDPINDYINILRIQESPDKVIRIIDGLTKKKSNAALIMASALLLESDKKKSTALMAITAAYPNFGPAFYELSNEFSQNKLEHRGINDKQKEKIYLNKFLYLAINGNVYKYYLDKKLAITAIKDAELRITKLNNSLDISANDKITYNINNPFSDHLSINLGLPEEASEITYSYDNKKYISTGYYDNIPGRKIPMIFFEPKRIEMPYKVYVAYKDLNNIKNGPFEINITESLLRDCEFKGGTGGTKSCVAANITSK